MKTTTVNFKNSTNSNETVTLNIYTKSEKIEFRANRIPGESGAVFAEDWEDEGMARVEKIAAEKCGIEFGEMFYWIRQ